jgi:predicted nucleic acid binding AN1-type Zn finger protein
MKCVLCSKKSSLIGCCHLCKNNYCNKHRLPEDHTCNSLAEYTIRQRELLTKSLLSQKIISKKLNF